MPDCVKAARIAAAAERRVDDMVSAAAGGTATGHDMVMGASIAIAAVWCTENSGAVGMANVGSGCSDSSRSCNPIPGSVAACIGRKLEAGMWKSRPGSWTPLSPRDCNCSHLHKVMSHSYPGWTH